MLPLALISPLIVWLPTNVLLPVVANEPVYIVRPVAAIILLSNDAEVFEYNSPLINAFDAVIPALALNGVVNVTLPSVYPVDDWNIIG